MKNTLIPLEHDEQVTFVEYLERLKSSKKIIAYTAIPQNMWTASWAQKVKAKKEGVMAGFPDLVIVTKTKVLFLEMKRKNGTIPRPEQQEWLSYLNNKQTVSGWARGSGEAIKMMEQMI